MCTTNLKSPRAAEARIVKRLIVESCAKQDIQRGQRTQHADRSTAMSSSPVAFLLADLGVTKTHSSPHDSDDNPHSESAFRTMKCRLESPHRFMCIRDDSHAFCQEFLRWDNEEHGHSGLALLTPAVVPCERSRLILENRQSVLDRPARTLRAADTRTSRGCNRSLDQQTAKLRKQTSIDSVSMCLKTVDRRREPDDSAVNGTVRGIEDGPYCKDVSGAFANAGKWTSRWVFFGTPLVWQSSHFTK
jgi:hypothetical protein